MSEASLSLRFAQRIGFFKIYSLGLDYKHLCHSLTFEDNKRSRLAAFEYHTDTITEIRINDTCNSVGIKPIFRHVEITGKAF